MASFFWFVIFCTAIIFCSSAKSSVPLKDYDDDEYYQKEEMHVLNNRRSIEKRSADSSAIMNTGSSSWSKLQISPHELGSMTYDHYGINIYGHSNNALSSVNDSSKQFFYAPISQLDHHSANASYNHVTEQAELQFIIEMWNEKLEEKVRKYTEQLVKHPVGIHQVRVLPLERVMLSSRIHSTAYQLNNQWIDYHRHRFMQFTFTCKSLYRCERLGHEMRTDPDQFENNLRLQFSMPAHSSERQETTIKIRNIVDGELVSQLIQKFPEASEVLLTAEDEQRVLSESATNVIVESFDDSAVVNPNSRKEIYEILKSLLVTSSTTINSEASKLWDSVFWNDDHYRPDQSSRSLNEIYRKLDKPNQEKLATSFNNVNKMGHSSSFDAMGLVKNYAEANVDFSRAGTGAKEVFLSTLEESKDHLQWDGEKFNPKQIKLSKFNLGKLRNEQSFGEVKMRIHYTTAMLSLRVNIKPPFKEVHQTLLMELTDKVEESISDSKLIKSEASNLFSAIKAEQKNLLRQKMNIERMVSEVNSTLNKKINGMVSQVNSTLNNQINGMVSEVNSTLNNKINGMVSQVNSTLNNKINGLKPAGKNYFSAQRSNPYDRSGSTIPYDSMEGIGGGMNISSGVFTAPRGGVYTFSFHGMRVHQIPGEGKECIVRLVKNGINILTGSSQLDWVPVLMTTNLKVKKGDNVSVFLEEGELYDKASSRYTVFSGFLLIEN